MGGERTLSPRISFDNKEYTALAIDTGTNAFFPQDVVFDLLLSESAADHLKRIEDSARHTEDLFPKDLLIFTKSCMIEDIWITGTSSSTFNRETVVSLTGIGREVLLLEKFVSPEERLRKRFLQILEKNELYWSKGN